MRDTTWCRRTSPRPCACRPDRSSPESLTLPPDEPPVGDPVYPHYPEYAAMPPYQPFAPPTHPVPGWAGAPPLPGRPIDPRRVRGDRIAAMCAEFGLIAVAVLQIPVILAVLHDRAVLHRFLDGTAVVDDLQRADDAVTALEHAVLVVALLTGALFVVWMWRLRADAEVLNPSRQQFGRGWVIGAWLIPFGNLVLPYLVTADLARGLRGPPWAVRGNQPRVGLIRAWWALWVVSAVGNRLVAADNPQSVGAFDSYVSWLIVTSLLAVAAAALAVAVVENLTRAAASHATAPPG